MAYPLAVGDRKCCIFENDVNGAGGITASPSNIRVEGIDRCGYELRIILTGHQSIESP
ncbi:hypothetical protein ACEYW6_24040 [Nostoc sp. UIC 10607]|uniref:hypothetical protein n=1 Tax=Nostoc sp. UIC 10607 TaxID=3045935 RepID=UPI0039A3D9E1